METAAELPVLLVYGIDPSWTVTEREEADRENRRLGFALRRQGHSVSLLPVYDSNLRGSFGLQALGSARVQLLRGRART